MAAKTDNVKRLNQIKELLECKTDVELAQRLQTQQPQISRWRGVGFRKSTANLIDILLSIISKQNREIKKLKKEAAKPKSS